jgi:hypothetical protein
MGEPVSLRALLQGWGLEPLIEGGLDGMSDDLLARVVPSFTDAAMDASALSQAIADGVPVLAPQAHAQRVLDRAGPDGLAFVTDPRWDAFDPPKVAMVSGWGRPGMPVDAVNDHDLALVSSFSEVLRDPRCLNLQMFHREDEKDQAAAAANTTAAAAAAAATTATATGAKVQPPPVGAARLPVLPELLDWPAPELFARGRTGKGRDGGCVTPSRTSRHIKKTTADSGGGGSAGPMAAVRVDRATRLSRQVGIEQRPCARARAARQQIPAYFRNRVVVQPLAVVSPTGGNDVVAPRRLRRARLPGCAAPGCAPRRAPRRAGERAPASAGASEVAGDREARKERARARARARAHRQGVHLRRGKQGA